MEFRLLGTCEVRRDGVALPLGGVRQRVVLGALALHANEVVSADRLTDAVWEDPPRSAGSNLRTYVSRLRYVLAPDEDGADRLVTRTPGYLLSVGDGESDVATFAALARLGREHLDRGEYGDAVRYFREALALWRGQPLDGLPLGPALQAEVAQWEQRRLDAAAGCAQAMLALGDHAGAVEALRDLVSRHPLREDLWARYMAALHRAGRSAEALAAYQEVRRRLVDELGLEPGAELQRVQRSILTGDPEAPAGPADPAEQVAAHRALPMDIAEFTGRGRELREIVALAEGDATATRVVTIQGMAGVGKTRLAVRAAHLISASGRFDDVQLHVDLHGSTAGRAPARPAEVLEGFLRLLGVPGDRIPSGEEERAALYRDRLHGRRVLVLLDNAAREDQVRPLLPGGSGAFVIVTSRHTLADLDGAHQMSLDVLTAEEAVALLARIAGPDRVAAEPGTAERIVALCGRLPIAVTLAARRLPARPAWSLLHLLGRLEAIDRQARPLGIHSRTVHATFDISYQALPEDQRRMFRLLSLHPGDDLTVASAAALAGTTPREAEVRIEFLLDEYLLQQPEPSRYRFHTLLRLYAADRADADSDGAERAAALARVLRWYLHAAHAAAVALDPHGRRVRPLPSGAAGLDVPRFAGHEEALAFLEAERANLVAAVQAAGRAGPDGPGEHDEVAWQLADTLQGFFHLRSHWDDWIATHRTALAAAERLGDQVARGRILDRLGVAYSDLRRHADAVGCHEEALRVQREAGDGHGEAWTLNNLGVVRSDQGRHAEALACFERAVELFRDAGDPRGQGLAMGNLGDTCLRLDRPGEAALWLLRALVVQEEAGDRPGQRYTLHALGDFLHALGQHGRAARCYERALVITRTLGDRWGVARLLVRLGDATGAAGDRVTARASWQEALGLFDELGDPRAAELRQRLRP